MGTRSGYIYLIKTTSMKCLHRRNNLNFKLTFTIDIIIQQIVTMPIYGKEALNICHLT